MKENRAQRKHLDLALILHGIDLFEFIVIIC